MLKFSLLQSTGSFPIAIFLFLFIIITFIFGHRVRRKTIQKHPDRSRVELGAINGTLLGLLGLLLAFTFNMASSRFDTRRQVIVQEANDIGTVILRTDIYPDSVRQLLRNNLKEYVAARIAFYRAGMDENKIIQNYFKADSIGKKIWAIASSYAKQDNGTTLKSQMIPALNSMIDISTTQRAAGQATIPDSIMYFLFVLCLCSAFLLGYDNKMKIDWIVMIGFAVMLSATVFTIVDLDRPRSGLINMDSPIQKIIELKQMFEE